MKRAIIITLMTLAMLAVAVPLGLMAGQAQTQGPTAAIEPYPAAGCTSIGTFPAPRYKTQVYAAPGFVFCHVFVVDPGGSWQFNEDGCKEDGFGNKRCVQGLGTKHLWVLTDGTFLLKTISPFVWAPTWLPIVQAGYP